MRTNLSLEYEHPEPLPDLIDSEVRTPPALVEHAVERFTRPGDVVFDPFAGFGTTLRVAERLDREGYGLEYEPDHVDYVRAKIDHPDRVQQGNALELPDPQVPPVDLCFTSPPFMVEGMETNPFENYAGESDYETYLADIRTAFEGVAEQLADDGTVAVDVVNVKYQGEVTTLAWDVVDAIGDSLHFDGELVVAWEESEEDKSEDEREGAYGYGFDHSYLLVFSRV